MDIDSVLRDLGIGVGGGSNIKSYQSGTATMPAGGTLGKTVPVNSVDINKSIMFFTYTVDDINCSPTQGYVSGKIDSSTAISFFRNATNVGNVTVKWTLVEFNNVKSKQSGRKTGTGNITVNTVNPLKCLLFVSRDSTSGGAYYLDTHFFWYEVVNSTTITINQYNIVAYFEWQLLEFN